MSEYSLEQRVSRIGPVHAAAAGTRTLCGLVCYAWREHEQLEHWDRALVTCPKCEVRLREREAREKERTWR